MCFFFVEPAVVVTPGKKGRTTRRGKAATPAKKTPAKKGSSTKIASKVATLVVASEPVVAQPEPVVKGRDTDYLSKKSNQTYKSTSTFYQHIFQESPANKMLICK